MKLGTLLLQIRVLLRQNLEGNSRAGGSSRAGYGHTHKPSLSLQTSSTSLLPTHPHEGLPVSSAAPAHPGSGPLVPSPRALLPDPPWLLLMLGSHGRPPRNGLPPLGLSDLLRALTTLHSLHQALRAQHSSPLLCYHLRAWFPSLSSPLRSAQEARSLAHRVASRAQSCASVSGT